MGSYNRKLRYDELIHTFLTVLPLFICILAIKYADRLFGNNLDYILLGLAIPSGILAFLSYAFSCKARDEGRYGTQAVLEIAWCMPFTILCLGSILTFFGVHLYNVGR